eukprot:CAMPEP_0182436460 /NCGR_PEP_ID=MMETSP1167-20130531/81746_1 /TAXON_ID=2988 /ORGANISM="Mallomonas Sp, Strain CCMP3275" /LENGTH=71 /DNA_ID=CAMNT_0024628669 /DNA_START=30 /DNA_END=242 /DNA_ORIENTATION=+
MNSDDRILKRCRSESPTMHNTACDKSFSEDDLRLSDDRATADSGGGWGEADDMGWGSYLAANSQSDILSTT